MGASLLSPTHLAVLAVIVLLLFGSKRLPEVARSFGTGLHEFKSSVSGLAHDGLPDERSAIGAAPEPLAHEVVAVTNGAASPVSDDHV